MIKQVGVCPEGYEKAIYTSIYINMIGFLTP